MRGECYNEDVLIYEQSADEKSSMGFQAKREASLAESAPEDTI